MMLSFSNNGRGIYVSVYYHELKIQNNNCTNNEYGIQVSDLGNGFSGIIENNRCNNNIQAGISVVNAHYVKITNNILLNNYVYGIAISANYCNITGNEIEDNGVHGIDVDGSDYCFIFENDITGSQRGINMRDSEYNQIFHNNIVESNSYGILIFDTANFNRIYLNNFIDNCLVYPSQQEAADDGLGNNFFDITSLRGNYWSDWVGFGTYAINGDANSIDLYPQGVTISW